MRITFQLRSFGNDFSPLSAAAQEGHLSVIRLLIDHSPEEDDAVDVNHLGQTPLFVASAAGHADAVRLLVEKAK